MAEYLSETSPLLVNNNTSARDIRGNGRLQNTNNTRRRYVINEESISVSSSIEDTFNGQSYHECLERVTGKPLESNILDANYDSMDYDNCENQLYQKEERLNGYKEHLNIQFARWLVMFLIGALTGLIACVIEISISYLSAVKYGLIKRYFDQNMLSGIVVVPFMIWVAWDVLFVGAASLLTVYGEPVAAGSGIPQIKCFLNGVKIPHVVRIKTLLCKMIGVIQSVVGGLAIGKEGPMIHSGAVVAAGISQGRSTTLKFDCKIFEYFRTDQEKRDFVSGGAAAGVSAAFGAPVGGVLFSLEEGASFWNQALTWRIFFASMVSTCTLNIVQSYVHNRPWELSYAGLLNFGNFEKLEYEGYEIPIYIVMGIIGGLLGALFNHINYKLTLFRKRYVFRNYSQVLEAIIVAAVSTTIAFALIYLVVDCQALGKDPNNFPLQVFCHDGQSSSMATMWMQTPEESVKSLFHDPPGTYRSLTIALFSLFYFCLATWTYGLSVPSGLFIPSLLTGAAWGRLIGQLLQSVAPTQTWIVPGKFALVGAAAMLGGVVRMTISLTVIMIEATGNIKFGLPLMIVLIVAKWVGDLFNEGLYDIHIELASVPLLRWEPPPMTTNILAREVMSYPVVVFCQVEKVGRIVDVLKDVRHDGFPVVDSYDPSASDIFGTLHGLVTRSQLIVLLQHKAYLVQETNEWSHQPLLCLKDFRRAYPRYAVIDDLQIDADERDYELDLTPFMNPAPYSVSDQTSMPRIFKLFRGLGLRHLVVVNRHNQVAGIVTRKDLARYKFVKHGGNSGLRELLLYVRK